MDPRSTPGFFIGYLDRSKGYRFYCPNRRIRIVESITAKFLENDTGYSGSSIVREVVLEPERIVVPMPIVQERIIPQTVERVNVEPVQQIDHPNSP